jgi:hypothetical protein
MVDNYIHEEGLRAWCKSMGISDDITHKVVLECEKITDANMCEAAILISQCYHEAVKKFIGLDVEI